MIIKKISIKNFRGIKELSNFELNKYNVLVGKNDSGKSIILYALKAFFDGKIDAKDIFKGAGNEDAEIEVSFSVEGKLDCSLLDSEGLLTFKHSYSNTGKS